MRSGTPVLSMRLATLTVFPQMSYCGFLAPITPATTGPMFSPVGTTHIYLLLFYSCCKAKSKKLWEMIMIKNSQMPLLCCVKVINGNQVDILLTNLHLEVVERVLVDVLHLLSEPHGIVG